MMRHVAVAFAVACLCFLLAACNRTNPRTAATSVYSQTDADTDIDIDDMITHQEAGQQMSNGVAGATLASEEAIFRAMGHGLLGQVFDNLRPQDQRSALEAEYRALEYARLGQNMTWQSTKENTSGTVTPGLPYRVGTQNCRQYRHELTIEGTPYQARGSACRNEDGSWSPLD